MFNPYAVYVHCDGAMDYDSANTGGIGFVISFPESVPLEPLQFSIGQYLGGNIERIEIEAIIQAMKETIKVFHEYDDILKNITQIIFITDRFHLQDTEITSPYRIKQWRHNKWKNDEGKPIKNNKLLDELDKTRTKLAGLTYARVNIEYRRRKENKAADKLAKAGKKEGIKIDSLKNKGEKIGKRKFDGTEIKYNRLNAGDKIHVNIYKKDPIQDESEISAEICDGNNKGCKLKIYTDNKLADKLNRGNEFIVRIKEVHRYHIRIFRTIEKIKKGK